MSDFSQGPGWWLASDGKWYPPQGETAPPAAPATPAYGQPTYAPQPDYSQPNYGAQPSYGAQPNYAAYGQQPGSGQPNANGLSVASMVLGIISVIFAFCFGIGAVTAIVGLPLGGVALSKMSKGEVSNQGKGMAIAGVVCSIIAIAMAVIWWVWISSSSTWHYSN